ncbi:MFS transporter [Streptomyces cavernicola]|uniref:MFS transporter n=1 Tax=Streptomyces cavernicola TaxID=3043613 RepID=A0ABT6SB67_9ACTN|nr:MFS transporter [Streptomyces sp. B-S-A6]MDI3404753.1 MFS transporter [Streptomyces sp. B-S-A6]
MPPTTATQPAAGSGRDLLEDSKLSSFHRRLTVYSAGGPFLDGLILGVIGVALTQLGPQWNLGGAWEGLLAAAALLGLLVGGTVFGYVTDRFGRHIMYTIDLAAIVVFSVAQAFVTGPEQLLVLRFLIGVAVGADYPIATSLLAEFSPRKHRGAMLGLLTVMWSLGSAAAYFIGDVLTQLGPDGWRWLLACPAIPAAVLVLMRMGTPESPRWLLSQGRTEEAQAVMRKVFGPHATIDDLEVPAEPARLTAVFRGVYGRRTVFVSAFWACSVMPIYAIYAFGPQLLTAMGLAGEDDSNLGSGVINLVFLLGCLVFLPLLGRIGRRPLLIFSFAAATLPLLVLGVFPDLPAVPAGILFAGYAIAIGGPTLLQWIYPNELFPTEFRATAVGIGTGFSRVAAAAGTFLTPIALESWGVGATLLIAGIVSLAGTLISVALAPETLGASLESSSRG